MLKYNKFAYNLHEEEDSAASSSINLALEDSENSTEEEIEEEEEQEQAAAATKKRKRNTVNWLLRESWTPTENPESSAPTPKDKALDYIASDYKTEKYTKSENKSKYFHYTFIVCIPHKQTK